LKIYKKLTLFYFQGNQRSLGRGLEDTAAGGARAIFSARQTFGGRTKENVSGLLEAETDLDDDQRKRSPNLSDSSDFDFWVRTVKHAGHSARPDGSEGELTPDLK
jgi:hypothetical protein